ncbi:putative transposase [Oscillibacter valericigenes Sjm18-20]|nr:putative transposase [Oscillibacter valericigenes Sjm18-20]
MSAAVIKCRKAATKKYMFLSADTKFFQLIARRWEKASTIFTSNKTFSQWNEAFTDVTITSAILDRVLHHCIIINIKDESYRLKERTMLRF